MLINRTSLARTVDGINAAEFEGRALAATERAQAAAWTAARQGRPGAYGGTFAGFPSERSKGIVLFTGERVASASASHILGEEASRALRLLRVRSGDVTRALEAADEGLMQCLARAARDPRKQNTPPFGARQRARLADVPVLVHGARAQRYGLRCRKGRTDTCSTGARTYGWVVEWHPPYTHGAGRIWRFARSVVCNDSPERSHRATGFQHLPGHTREAFGSLKRSRISHVNQDKSLGHRSLLYRPVGLPRAAR